MNPFNKTTENDKAQLWETLVERDSLAFVNQDWSLVKDDFVSDNFMGIHANFESNPDLWKISFPDLKSYREEWLKDAKEFCDEIERNVRNANKCKAMKEMHRNQRNGTK